MTEDKKPFMPLEAVKKLARLRQLKRECGEEVSEKQTALETTDEYKDLVGVNENLLIINKELVDAEALFKAGCEDIFEETDEKKFPGGQIKMRTTFEYDEGLAVEWAIKHDHPELLKILKAGFKNACKTLKPPFVQEGKVGKMYIDSDLSEFLEGN